MAPATAPPKAPPIEVMVKNIAVAIPTSIHRIISVKSFNKKSTITNLDAQQHFDSRSDPPKS